MRRFRPVLVAIAVTGFLGPVAGGAPRVALVFAAPTLVAGAVLIRANRRPVAEPHWSGAARSADGLPAARAADPPRAGAITLTLGGVSSRELASSPYLDVGLGFCVLFVFAFAGATEGTSWAEISQSAPWLAHPLVGMCVLAAGNGGGLNPRSPLSTFPPLSDGAAVFLSTRQAWWHVVWLAALTVAVAAVAVARYRRERGVVVVLAAAAFVASAAGILGTRPVGVAAAAVGSWR